MNDKRLPNIDQVLLSISICDVNGGGSGFATQAPNFFDQLFAKAHDFLECPYACENACDSCLIQFDTHRIAHLLSRNTGLEFLDTEFLSLISLQEEDKLLGEDSEFCPNKLQVETDAYSKYYNECLKVYFSGDTLDWEIGSSEFKRICLDI